MPQIVREMFEGEFCRRMGCAAAVAVNSGTSALVGALLALDLRGGEVITTPFSFPSTWNAILLAGGVPRFVDIRSDDHLIDPSLIEAAVNERTRAILPVHLFGRVCDMRAVMEVAARHGLNVVEDTAQALGKSRDGRLAGTFGDFGCFSFYKTKSLSTFEGGMVAVRDEWRAERLRQLVDPIANRVAGFPVAGHNFRMPEPCALIGLERMKLHWPDVVAHSPPSERNGFYPYVAHELPAFRQFSRHCPVAEALSTEIAARCAS